MLERYDQVEHVDEAGAPGDRCEFLFRKSARNGRPFTVARDFTESALISLTFPIAWLLPVRTWIRLRNAVEHIMRKGTSATAELRVRSAYEKVLGTLQDDEWDKLRRGQIGHKLASRFAIAREYSTKWHDPVFEVDGHTLVLDALGRGKGAILWVNPFSGYPVLSKRALFQNGIAALAVSHTSHGYTSSRLAEHSINKIHIAAENRYLRERLVFSYGEEARVQKRAFSALNQGLPVIFTNASLSGHRFVELPLGPSGPIRFSTGPIILALRMGVQLYSVSVFETEPFTRYRAEVLPLGENTRSLRERGSARTDYRAMAQIARESRDIILDGIRRYPEQSARFLL